MKIELKNFKHAAFASEETLCFSASVYVDGQRTLEASNSGKGEANRIQPIKGKSWEDVRRVENWIATLPKVKLDETTEIDDDMDFYFSRLASREVSKKHLKSLLKKHVVIFDPNTKLRGLQQFASSFNPNDLNDTHRKHLFKTYPGCLILNDLGFEQAADLYIASDSSGYLNIDEVYQEIKGQAA